MSTRVLYVSKALVVAAYRDKLVALREHVDVTGLMPHRWGRTEPEAGGNGTEPIRRRALAHGSNHLHVYLGLGPLLDRLRPHLVHIDEEPYSAVTLQVSRLCRRRGIPTLFFAWQNIPKRLPPPFALVRARVFRHARGGIAGTRRAGEVLREAGWASSLAVIPQFGVDPDRFRPDARARERGRAALGLGREFVIGFGGRLVPEKGIDHLLDALTRLPAARLMIIGEGPERHGLERRTAELGLGERVHFAGQVPSAEMPAHLAACDALVLPSVGRPGWMEQFGRILVEAMACGVPVVGSDSGEIPTVIGDAGMVVPAGRVEALAAALRRLADSETERREAAERGRARVLDHYTNARIAAATASFYGELLGRRVSP